MHISGADLRLFIVFDAIDTEGSVTRASVKLNLTQPAISHALGRLRTMFGDPLFVRNGHLMVSAPLARSIIEPVRQSPRGFEVTLNELNRFDPASTGKQFTLALRDVLEATVLPPLMTAMDRDAPRARVAAVQVDRRKLEGALQAGTPGLRDRRAAALGAARSAIPASWPTARWRRRGHPRLAAQHRPRLGPLDLAGRIRRPRRPPAARRHDVLPVHDVPGLYGDAKK